MNDKMNYKRGEGADDFRDGRIKWVSGIMKGKELKDRYLHEDWQDGFVAFSSEEIRLRGFDQDWNAWLCDDKKDANKGYLMEAGLWRNNGALFEELSFERQGERFFVQYWRLDTGSNNKSGMKCYYRDAGTFVRGNIKIFNPEIPSFEVVVPDSRLRFYITGRK